MKIRLLENVTNFKPGAPQFHAHRIYSARLATEEPGFARLGKVAGLVVKKIHLLKGTGKKMQSALLDRPELFEIIDFPEKQTEMENYQKSKIKEPKVKLICRLGFKLRDGFRPITNDEITDLNLHNIFGCQMGKGGQNCGNPMKFVRTNLNKSLTPCCEKCGTRSISMII